MGDDSDRRTDCGGDDSCSNRRGRRDDDDDWMDGCSDWNAFERVCGK